MSLNFSVVLCKLCIHFPEKRHSYLILSYLTSGTLRQEHYSLYFISGTLHQKHYSLSSGKLHQEHYGLYFTSGTLQFIFYIRNITLHQEHYILPCYPGTQLHNIIFFLLYLFLHYIITGTTGFWTGSSYHGTIFSTASFPTPRKTVYVPVNAHPTSKISILRMGAN